MKRMIKGKMAATFGTRSLSCAATLAALVFLADPARAATLYVDASTGNDATSKTANGPSSPWRTIGRAAWGSTSRSSPNASQAAAAGDTVIVAGGTYIATESVNNRWGVVYNPVNGGTADLPITFTCAGACVLGAPNANAPVIGADGRNYIKWYADISQGHAWLISAYGRESGSASATQVNTAPDTGPVVGHSATGIVIEGATIDGGLQTDYTDNWNGIRFENCTSCTIRNNTIRNFQNGARNSNGTGITLYGCPNTVIENNYVTNAGAGVSLKDQTHTLQQSNVHVRLNRLDDTGRCFSYSMTAENRNYVYKNICSNSMHGLFVTGGGLSNDWIFNNTFYNVNANAVYLANSSGSGGRFWNNIVVAPNQVIQLETISMPTEAIIDLEHNLYWGFRQFYSGTDGSRTFAAFKSSYPTHDQSSPASVEGNPQFVNAAAGDLRLCTGSGTPAASCSGASPALRLGVDILDLNANGSMTDLIPAGAYVSNNEQIGPGGTGAAPTVPPSPPTNLTTD